MKDEKYVKKQLKNERDLKEPEEETKKIWRKRFCRIPESHMWSQLTWANPTKRWYATAGVQDDWINWKSHFSHLREVCLLVCLLFKFTIISLRIWCFKDWFSGKNNDQCSPLAARNRNFLWTFSEWYLTYTYSGVKSMEKV